MSAPNSGPGLALPVVTVLLLGTTGSTVFLGVKHRQMVAMNQTLLAQCDALEQDRKQKSDALEQVAAKEKAAEAEIQRLSQQHQSATTTVVELRDNLSSLEKRASSLQDEIATAQKDGTLKEARIAELMGQLAETKASADKTVSQLKSLGYTNSELSDQVGKLQSRLSSSQASLDSASRLIEEQKRTIAEQTQTIAATQAAASATAAEAERLRQSNADLARELDSRPKVSVFKESDLYKPSRDRKKK